MTALCQEQDTLGQQRCPQSNLRPFPHPRPFLSGVRSPRWEQTAKVKERVSGEGELELAATPGRRENAGKRGGHGLVKREPVERMGRGLLLSQGTQAPREYWGLDQDSSWALPPLELGSLL